LLTQEHRKSHEYLARTLESTNSSAEEQFKLSDYESRDAMGEILAAAYDYDIIMLSDGQNRPEHRVFAAMLLEDLMNLGFSKIAFDDIMQSAAIIKLTKIPEENLGGLIIEPNYANLLRESQSLGFEIIPHKYQFPSKYSTRDSIDALGIFDHQQNDMSKIIIYCTPKRMDKDNNSLAFWLEKFTGKSVLTIDQSTHVEQYERQFETTLYKAAVSLNSNTQPFMLRSKSEEFMPSEINIFHPRVNYLSGRASWLTDYRISNRRYLVNFPRSLLREISENRLVQVYFKHEFELGVPIDQFLYKTLDSDHIPLVLPEGEFVLLVEDQNRDKLLQVSFNFSNNKGLEISEE